jgi:ProP effector
MSSTEPLPPQPDDTVAAEPSLVAAASESIEPAAPAPRPPEISPAECVQQLKQRFPALFTGAPKPIKLRVQVDIQERAPGVFTKHALSAFFRRYTGTTSYLQSVANGTQRFDLDGQPSGEISAEHRQIAADELARRRANHAAQQAEQRAAARAADAQAQEARTLEIQQRRNRAGLLYDYERTTLTRANFCVLKGVAEAELDGLLAIAREEAAQPRGPEARPRRDDRPQGRRDGAPPPHRGPRPGQAGLAPKRR